MNRTEHYGLLKPQPEEFFDIGHANQNMTKIDDEMHRIETDFTSQLAQTNEKKADITYVNQQVQASNTQWKRSFATLADLQSTYPNGDTFNHVVLADGFIYTWFDGAWTSTQIEANARKLADGVVSPQKTSFVKTGKNLFNKNDYNVGLVANANTGALVPSSSNNSSSKYMSVLPNQSYVKSPSAATESAQVFYDANFNYISSSTGSPFTAPANAAWVIVNIADANIANFQIELGDVATDYEDYYLVVEGLKPQEIEDASISEQKTTFASKTKNILNTKDINHGMVVNASGALVPSSSGNSSFNVTDIDELTTYTKNFGAGLMVAFFKDDNFLKYVTGITVTTPTNTNRAIVNVPDVLISSAQMERGSISTDYEPYGIKIDLASEPLSHGTLGVAYHLTQSASTCIRLDGKTNLDECYPFNEVKLCNVLKTDFGGTQITYSDSALFKRDGSNGHVMVEIPKVYYKRYRKNNYEYILISGVEYDGFNLHPAFIENGKQLEKIYVAAYDSVLFNDMLFSRSGLKPASDYTITEARNLSKANGRGFGLFDMRTLNLVQMLFLIYFADRNSQSVLGRGMVSYSWQSSAECICRLTATQTNTIRVRYDYESYALRGFAVGQNVTVSQEGVTGLSIPRKITAMSYVDATYLDITFDGTPVDLVDGTSKIYSLPCDTGATDSIAHHVGISSVYGGKDGHEAIKFLHIENLWGNIWNYIDGFAVNDLVAYVSDNMDDYTSELGELQSKYKPLGWRVPLQDTNRQDAAELTTCYVKNMMYDATNAAYLVPLELGNGSSDTQGFADPFYSYGDGLYFSNFGGGIDHVIRAGLFTHRVWVSETSKNILLNGSRLQFKPL